MEGEDSGPDPVTLPFLSARLSVGNFFILAGNRTGPFQVLKALDEKVPSVPKIDLSAHRKVLNLVYFSSEP